MSVRGTVFKVSVKYDENGESYATLNVYEGSVKTELVFPDGTISDPIVVKKGYAVDTHGTDKLSEYIISKNATEDNDFVYPIDYSSLSKQELESLLEIYNHEKKELSIAKEEVQELLKEKNDTKEETKYTVNFYNQDELLETQVTSEINYPNPNKKGYTFDGWYEDSNLTIKHESSTVTSDLNLYGKWTPKNYKISFDSQGGNTLDAKEVTYDQTYGDLPTPTRQGYTFTGWYLNNTHITSQSKVQIMQDTTLKASWKANEHTVYQVNHYQENLDNDGYTLVDNQQLNGTTNSQVTPNTHLYDGFKSPSKKEVIIKGDGTTVVNYYYQRNLYALTIDGDSGIVSSNGQGNYRYGQNASFNVEVKEGYTFDHFEINNEPITNNLTITKDTKVKAITKINTYTISYELNGGKANHLKDTYTVQDEYQLPIPKKKGYTFIGWNDGTHTNPLKDMKLSKGTTGNKTYTAYYKASTYQISFNTDGGNEIKDKTVTYESTYGKLETPTKQGYTFVGWYLKDTPITEETQVDITSDTTLKAKWQANTDTSYKVKYLIESLDDSQKYEEYKTVDATGTTDQKAQPKAIEIEGFTPDQFNEVTIKGDGTTVCEYKYTRNTYTVSLQTDAGVKTLYNAGSYKYGKAVTVSVDLKTGYQIQSWSYPKNSTSKDTSLKFNVPAQNINIVVKTEVITYSVDYDQKDGVVDSPLITHYTVNDEFTLPALTKKGYTFTGWTLEGSNADPIKNYKVTKGTTGNLKFIANFEAINYSITYKDAEMKENSVKSYTIETNEFTLSEPKAKTGYTFEGWKENVSDAPNKNLTIKKGSTGDKTFTASWKANTYKINFIIENCGGFVYPQGQSQTMEVTYGETYGDLLTMKRYGYDFVGWSTSQDEISDKTRIAKGDKVKITQDISVYPHWTARNDTKYVVQYWIEGLDGKDTLKDSDTFEGTTDTEVTVNPKEYDGFETPDPIQSFKIEARPEGSAPVSCAFKYKRKTYEIKTNNTKGITSFSQDKDAKYEAEVTVSAQLQSGYEIESWQFTDEKGNSIEYSCNEDKTKAKIQVPASNVNVTVVTKPIEYKIILDKGEIKSWNGLSDPQKPFTFESKLDLPIPSNNEISSGCTFAGWYYKDDKTESKIESEKDLIGILSSLNTREITLTAKWTKTYTVKCSFEKLNDTKVDTETFKTTGFLGDSVMSVVGAKEILIKDFSKDSKLFDGYDDPTDSSETITENMGSILYHFTLKTYTVTFTTDNLIGLYTAEYKFSGEQVNHSIFIGDSSENSIEFKHGIELNYYLTPLDGYEITVDNGTKKVGPAIGKVQGKENGNANVKINVTEKVYKINCNAGTDGYFGLDEKNNKITSQGYDYTISHEDITLPEPKRDGYRFKGYKLEPSDSNELYTVVSKGSTGNLNFVAQWEKDSSTYNVYLECKRDYHEGNISGSTITIKKLATYQLKDDPFPITLTPFHQHEGHKIKWRRYYSDTQYSDYDNGTTVTIDPSMEKEDIYFVAVYDDEK